MKQQQTRNTSKGKSGKKKLVIVVLGAAVLISIGVFLPKFHSRPDSDRDYSSIFDNVTMDSAGKATVEFLQNFQRRGLVSHIEGGIRDSIFKFKYAARAENSIDAEIHLQTKPQAVYISVSNSLEKSRVASLGLGKYFVVQIDSILRHHPAPSTFGK